MYPEQIVKEEKMAEAIEEWENYVNILDNQGPEFKMNYQMKLIALQIMFTKFPAIFESIEVRAITRVR